MWTLSKKDPNLIRTCKRRKCSGTIMKELLGQTCWNQRPELSWFFFFFFQTSSLPVPDVCTGLRKNKCGQFIFGLEKDNSQCSMFKQPPCWAARAPVDTAVVWCWTESKNPPSQQHREGWNIERETGTEEERVEREEPSTDGRPSWWKMAAVFSADYERTALEKTGGSVCDSTQQNREAHAEVKPAGPTSAFWVGDHEKCSYFPLCCLSSHCVCYRFSVSAPHWFLLRPPSHQNPSTSFDLTSEYASHDQTTEDPRQTERLN